MPSPVACVTRGAKRAPGRLGYAPLPAVMYVAGDDADAKRVVLGLVSELGFQAIDAGKLAIARLLEPMAMLWIHMTMNRDQDLATAYALTHRP